MELPSILPNDLKGTSQAADDRALYEMLLQSTERLTRFFSFAADDETWSTLHESFHRQVLIWFTNQYVQNRLAEIYVKTVVASLHDHYSILGALLPRPISIQAGNLKFATNPLVLGFMSPYFKSRLDKNVHVHEVSEKATELVEFALKYLESGNAENLWRFEKPKVMELMLLAEKWGVLPLSRECEAVLRRYISRENVQEELVLAYQHGRHLLLERALEVFNEAFSHAKVFTNPEEPFAFEFLDFEEEAFEAFNFVKSMITHLHFKGELTLDPSFIKVIEQCPRLTGLVLRQSNESSPLFQQIPSKIHALDVSECAWLSDRELRQLISYVPAVFELKLAQDTQLTYRGFSELKNLRGLKSLNLSRCSQLKDEDLNLILQGSPGLVELNLYGCRKLSDEAFYEIARRAVHLQKLKVSRTLITDGGIATICSRCHELGALELNHCLNITEGALFDSLKLAKQLKSLSIKDNRLNAKSVQALKDSYPNIEIDY